MLKKLALAGALLLAFLGAAQAQNVTCFTATAGDSTNKCASTKFVGDAISSATSGAFITGTAPINPSYLSGVWTIGLNYGTGLTVSGGNLILKPAAASEIGGVNSKTCAANQAVTTIGTDGSITCTTFTSSLTPVSGTLNVYVSPTGSDTTGDGTSGNPWATCAKAIAVTQSAYDLGYNQSNVIKINFDDGTYVFDNSTYCQLSGAYAGQITPSQVVFTATNTGSWANVVIKNSAGYGWGCNYRGMATVQWLTFDGTNNNNDLVNVTSQCYVVLQNDRFQYAVNPNTNILAAYGALIQINGEIRLYASAVSTTGTWSGSSSTLTVADATGIRVGMGALDTSGGTISTPCIVSNVVGTTVTINCTTTGPGAGANLQFLSGGQNFISAGVSSTVIFNTNDDPAAAIPVSFFGTPYFYNSTVFASTQSQVSISGVTWNNANTGVFVSNAAYGYSYDITLGGRIDTGLKGFYYVPGSKQLNDTTTISSTGIYTLTVGSTAGYVVGQSINGWIAPTSTFSSGVSSITVSAGTQIEVGNAVVNPCIPGGTTVTSVAGTTIGLSHATICALTGTSIFFNGSGVPNGTTVTGIASSTVLNISQPTYETGTFQIVHAGHVPNFLNGPFQ